MDPLLAHPGQWSRQSVQNRRRPETPTRDSKTALKIQATLTAEGGRSGHVRAVIHRHVPKNPRHRPIFFFFPQGLRLCLCFSKPRLCGCVLGRVGTPTTDGGPIRIDAEQFQASNGREERPSQSSDGLLVGARLSSPCQAPIGRSFWRDASIASNWISRRRCKVELGMVWTDSGLNTQDT